MYGSNSFACKCITYLPTHFSSLYTIDTLNKLFIIYANFVYTILISLPKETRSMTEENVHFTFKPLMHADMSLLQEWFAYPHVKKWWPIPQEEEYFTSFLQRIKADNTMAYLVCCNTMPIGYIQYYYIDKVTKKLGGWLPALPPYTIGTDQFIGDPLYIGKGYGTQFIQQFITQFLPTHEPQAHTVIVDPDPKNHAAIRCYQKVGFYTLGVTMAPWGPALLMRYDLEKE